MREITAEHLGDMACGAAILGTGGGGDPYVGLLLAEQAIKTHGPVTLLAPDEVPDDAVVVPSAFMGAPTVMLEKLPSGDEMTAAFRGMERALGRAATHVVAMEAGGLNSMIPFVAAAEMGIPLIDADGMGRAYPELQMVLPTLGGVAASPMVLADERGNTVAFETMNNSWAERLARTVVTDLGCSAALSTFPLTGAQVKSYMVHGTLTLCEEIGRAVRVARKEHADPVAAATAAIGGAVLFTGKIADVERSTSGGFARGVARFDGIGPDDGARLEIEFQNENLVARQGDRVLASVPDLISVLDSERGDAVTTERLRYGLRTSVVVSPCDPRWRTPEGLALGGPAYFGYGHTYQPV